MSHTVRNKDGQIGELGASSSNARRAAAYILVSTIAVAIVLLFALSSSRASGFFEPTIDLELSTTRATAHPDARITIDTSQSSEDIKEITIDLPNGLWGSLNAADKCDNATATTGTCPAGTQVGTVINEARVDESDVRLEGKVFLTEPEPAYAGVDPAGLLILVPAKVGGADMGTVRVRSRAMLRRAALPASPPAGSEGVAVGIRTVVDDVPNSITDSHGRTVTFHLEKLEVHLRSDQTAPHSPLLTNPSKCGAISIAASATSYDSTVATLTDPTGPLTIDSCDSTLKYGLSTFSMVPTPAVPTANQEVVMNSTISFPQDSATSKRVEVKLPSSYKPNFPSFGDSGPLGSSDMCQPDAAVAVSGNWIFSPTTCPAQSKIGSATVSTPLLDDPVVGDVYFIDRSPIPWLGIDVDPSKHGNPAGVSLRLLGTTDLTNVEAGCDGVLFSCPKQIVATFDFLPDAPFTNVQLSLGGSDRTSWDNQPIPGKILKTAAPNDPACQPTDDSTGAFVSNSGSSIRSQEVAPMSISGCNSRTVAFDAPSASNPVGMKTTDRTPEFSFTNSEPTGLCAVDTPSTDSGAESTGTGLEDCVSPYTAYAPSEASPYSLDLAYGLHRVWVMGNPLETRAFVVAPVAGTPDTTAPITTIDSGPASTTSDTTPDWSFTSTETGRFQCSVDGGAFLPCEQSAPAGTSGAFAVDDSDAFLAGSSHAFAVRAQDAAGNVGPADSVTIDVSVPFEPTFDVSLTTSEARAHPEMDITITNPSEQDLEDTTLKLPDGLFGGLQGVQSVCAVATADAGNCSAASQVGTIDTEAVVDQSIVRITGQLYLTEARVPGDAAGLSIKVPAKIQDINMGDIVVPARLSVRGEAQGVDSLVFGVPREIDPPDAINPWDSTTQFTMRKLKIKLRNNPGAAQPLLTNPSSCAGGAFIADFKTYESGTASLSQPFSVSGCDALGFSPQLSVSVTKPNGSPPNGDDYQPIDISASLKAKPDDAGISGASILMPKPLTVDAAKLPSVICEVAQYPDHCPAVSQVGTAEATSPLLLPGETLAGPVYLLRNPGKVLPKLYATLKGRISVKVTGVSRFENETQIRTVFSDLPDAPVSTFTMKITDFMLTMDSPCDLAEQFGSDVNGTLSGHNGKSAAVRSSLNFNCTAALRDGIGVKKQFKKRGVKTTLSLGLRAKGKQPNMRKVKLRLGKHLQFNPNQIAKKLLIRVNGKRMSRARIIRSIKVSGNDTLEFSFDKRRYRRIDFTFRSGTLVAGPRLRRPTVSVTVSPGLDGKSRTTKVVNLAEASVKRYRISK